jgi:hypothetical protein
VYKRGHEPADADLHVDKSHVSTIETKRYAHDATLPQVQVLQPSKRKKQAKGEPGGPIADHISDISLIAAGQVKRDRRSVAQIQQVQPLWCLLQLLSRRGQCPRNNNRGKSRRQTVENAARILNLKAKLAIINIVTHTVIDSPMVFYVMARMLYRM